MNFILNKHYKNNDIVKHFGGSNTYGMRYHENKSGKAHLVLISKVSNNIYSDQIQGNTLLYTGMGTKGNQSMTSENKRLRDSVSSGLPVYLFFKVKPNDYVYIGQVKLIKRPYPKKENGRNVIIFPITTAGNNNHLAIYNFNHHQITKEVTNEVKRSFTKKLNHQHRITKARTKRAVTSSTKLLEHRVHKNEQRGTKLIGQKRNEYTSHYVRNPDVAELARRFAKGRCQLCMLHGKPGRTFIMKGTTNKYYLESHHIKWLSHGGPDSIKNVIALCPTCHRQMHFAKNTSKDVKLLKERALTLAKKHGF